MYAILIGLLSSMFFAATFVVTKIMGVGGTDWAWTSSLRFVLALPFLFLIVLFRKEFKGVILSIKNNFLTWFLWGNLAGVGFYSLLSFGTEFSPSWLVAGTWQITIIAGLLLSPLFFITINIDGDNKTVRGKIPLKRLCVSSIVLIGVILMQYTQAQSISIINMLKGFIPVVIAAFLYPLGNRKLMAILGKEINSFQRSFGVALISMPLAIILGFIGYHNSGALSKESIVQALILAVFSGVFATILFFFATDKAKHNLSLLAGVEATQAGTIIFTIIGSMIFLNSGFPSGLSLLGIIIIIIGMIINSFLK
ncbi:multidrug resistance efflux transporter family protein [Clostridium sp.]|uniref:DMT family transporter n=1 Tax=Clostridium sp. TaxID=1506 RepID=UPI00260BD4B0|nr:multidrug resistance efflux transporter family protein [Clostridium sp.]